MTSSTRSRIFAIGVLVALATVASACSSDSADNTTTTAEVSLTTTSAPTTTTTATPSTTTAPTTTTTVPATTTTTTLPEPEFGFFVDGFGIVDFGASPDEVQAALDPLLGPPTIDSGWLDEPLCPGDEFRFLQYGDTLFDFRVLFAVGDPFTDSIVHPGYFFSYNYNGVTDVPVEAPALTVGTTVAELEALYPDVTYQENPFVASTTDYVVDGSTDLEGLIGQVSGTDPDATVESVQGGIGCGE